MNETLEEQQLFYGKSHGKNSKHQYAKRCFVAIISHKFLLPQHLYIILNKYPVHIHLMGRLCAAHKAAFMLFLIQLYFEFPFSRYRVNVNVNVIVV